MRFYSDIPEPDQCQRGIAEISHELHLLQERIPLQGYLDYGTVWVHLDDQCQLESRDTYLFGWEALTTDMSWVSLLLLANILTSQHYEQM